MFEQEESSEEVHAYGPAASMSAVAWSGKERSAGMLAVFSPRPAHWKLLREMSEVRFCGYVWVRVREGLQLTGWWPC